MLSKVAILIAIQNGEDRDEEINKKQIKSTLGTHEMVGWTRQQVLLWNSTHIWKVEVSQLCEKQDVGCESKKEGWHCNKLEQGKQQMNIQWKMY